MNAYELADALDCLKSEYLIWDWAGQAQDTLRQQQAEIEALKTLLDKGCLDSKSYVIGWEDGKSTSCACREPLALNTVHRKDSPCYTKEELTDEEIEKVFYDTHFGFKGRDDSDFMDFARAILRKASEK